MPDQVGSITLPVPVPPAHPLPAWQVFRLLRRNIIATWPRAAYEDMVVRRRLFGTDTLIVSDPALVRHVLTSNAANYERPLSIRRPLRPALRNGLALSEGADWRRQRRMLAPLFTPQHVGSLLPHFAAAGAGLLAHATGERVNLADLLQRAAVDAVCRALFSVPAEAAGGAGLPGLIREFLEGVGRITIWDVLSRREADFAWFMRGRVAFAARWTAGINAVIAARDALPPDAARRDVLQLLRDARDPEGGGALTEDEIGEQVATLLAAGFETTARAMFWTVYLLSFDRPTQTAIRAELAAFPPGRVRMLADLVRWPALRRAFLRGIAPLPAFPVHQPGRPRARPGGRTRHRPGRDRVGLPLDHPSAPPVLGGSRFLPARPLGGARGADRPEFPALRRRPADLHRRRLRAGGGHVAAGNAAGALRDRAGRCPAGAAASGACHRTKRGTVVPAAAMDGPAGRPAIRHRRHLSPARQPSLHRIVSCCDRKRVPMRPGSM